MKASSGRGPDRPGSIHILARKPLDIPAYAFPIRLERKGQRVVVLCSVNNLNRFPKTFPLKVQGVFPFDDNFGNYTALCTERGIIYTWGTSIH